MHKLSYKTLLIIFFFLLIGIIVLWKFVLPNNKVSAAWWNDSWMYRQKITTTNGSGSNQTNTKVRVLFNYDLSSFVTAGKLQSSLNDIRFTDINGKLLTYWIEDSTNNSVDIWVLMPSIPSSGSTIYMYYGNSSATTMSNSGATPSSCLEIVNVGITASGNYWIDPDGSSGVSPFTTYCDLSTDSGGWTMLFNLDTSDGNKRTWTDTSFWLGIGTTGNVSNALTADFKSGAYSSSNLGNEMMVLVHNEGSSIYGKALYDVLTAYKTVSLYGVFNAGTTNVTITGTRKNLIDFTDPGTPSDTFIEETNALKINDKREGDGHGTGVSHTYVRFTTTAGENNPSHNVIGLGGEHDSNDSCGHWGWDYEAQNHQSYCNIYAIGTDWVDKGYLDYESCPAGQKDVDYAVFSREATPTLKNISSSSPTTEERSPAPIAYWKFDEGVGTTAYDSSGQNNTGIFLSSPIWKNESECVSGKCLAFDNVDDGVSINKNFTGLTDYTMTAWINLKGTHKNYTGTIMSSGNWNTSQWVFGINQANTAIDLFNKGSKNYAFQLNKWTYVTVTRSGSQYTFYVDGKSIGGYGGDSVPLASDATNTTIGRETYAGGYFAFNGWIDEPKIYPYARTAAQIKLDYNAGKSHASSSKGSSANLGGSNKSGEFLSNGLVGYWKMDENIGTTTADSSGNNKIGTFIGGSLWGSGKFGVGVSFSGANYIDLGTNVVNQTAYTKTAWIKTNTQNANNIFSGTGSGHVLYTTGGQIQLSNTYSSPIISAAANFYDNNWHFVVATYDGIKSILYMDGIKLAEANMPNIPAGQPAYIGAYAAANQFIGLIDEVRLYNRALSPSEVSQLYNWAPGPVGYWDFNDGTGNIVQDKSGLGNTGIWSGTGSHWTQGKIGGGGNFNGSSDYVNVGNHSTLDLSTFTVSVWVNLNQKTNHILMQKYPSGSNDNYSNYYLTLGTTVYFSFGYGTGQESASYDISNFIWNKWVFLTGTYDGNKIRIYQNGVEMNSSQTTHAPYTGNQVLRIGQGRYDDYFTQGKIDDVKIYNYARTQKQIVEDMNAGHPAGGSPVGSQLVYYKFDEGYGTIAHDEIKYRNGTLSCAGGTCIKPTWKNEGKFNKALYFSASGTDEPYVTTSPINIGSTLGDKMTWTMWVKPDPSQTGSGWLMRNGTGADENYGWDLGSASGGMHRVQFTMYDTAFRGIPTAGNYVPNNIWSHLTIILSQGQWFKVYVNGVFKEQKTIPYGISVPSTSSFNIGGHNGTSGQYLNGYIDEFKIYNYELTDDEVKIDYNRGSATQFGSSTQTIGATTTSLDYCIPGDTSPCASPIAEYKMDEGVGTTAYDTSGNGVTCSLNGSANFRPGKIGQALNMTSSSDYATCGTTFNPTQPITLEGWVYMNSLATNNIIASKDGTWTWYIRNSGGTQLSIYGSSEVWAAYTTFNPNTWYFVTTTIDASNNVKHFVNGQLMTNTLGSTTTLTPNANIFTIGKWSTSHFNGKIDQVKIYNYARTPAQIAYDYNKGGPIGWWKFDECQGNTAYDWSGIGNTGTIIIGASGSQNSLGTCQVGTSAAWTNGASGKINGSLNFDGTDDAINTNLSFTNPPALTYSAWIKTNSPNTKQWIICPDDGGYDWTLLLENGKVALMTGSAYWDSTYSITTAWTHVVAVFDTSISKAKLYINGQFISDASSFGATTTGTLIIGSYRGNSFPGPFSGQIDDIRIYNYALTPTQVKTLFNGGSVNFN